MSVIAEITEAARVAEGNYEKNATALAWSLRPAKPQAAESGLLDVEWVFGRDGGVTALERDGSWYGGCSVPVAGGRAMVESVTPTGNVGLFLAPPQAGAIGAVLEKLASTHAIVAIYPEDRDFVIAMHCRDFSSEVENKRVFFVHGADWVEQFRELFRSSPGIPTPTYLIRVLATQAQAEGLVPVALKLIDEEMNRRSAQIAQLRSAPRAKTNQLCVIGSMNFRVWADAGYELAEVVRTENPAAEIVDLDRLDQSSPMALALVASRSDAIIAANLGRSDVPNLVAEEQAWITWVTAGRIPKFSAGSPKDGLIVAHPRWQKAAIEAGWPAERVVVGTWPDPGLREYPQSPASRNEGGDVVFIHDCTTIVNKPGEFEFSSHRLLWEHIYEELSEKPLAVGSDLDAYLNSRMAKLKIAREGFNRELFIAQLILPTVMGAIGKKISAKTISAAEIGSRDGFKAAVANAKALVDAWPFMISHPVRDQARPYVKVQSNLSLSSPINPDNMPKLSCDMIHRLLRV